MEDPSSSLTQLETRLGVKWSNLREARARSEAKLQEVRSALAGLDSEDTSIVVSGSLARGEFTDGSDIDWRLLVDGYADQKHL